MSEIKSQSELEGMLNDPEKMSEYVKEKALDVLGSAVKEQMDEAMRDGAINRPPMTEETSVEAKGFSGTWGTYQEEKLKTWTDNSSLSVTFWRIYLLSQ